MRARRHNRSVRFGVLCPALALLMLACAACKASESADGPSGLRSCSESEYNDHLDFSYAQHCAPSTECNGCPDDALCLTGMVSGQNGLGGTYRGGLCTQPCTSNADCASLHYVQANKLTNTNESWSCRQTERGRFCAVQVSRRTSSSGGGSGCNDGCLTNCTVGLSCVDICCH